MISKIGVEHSEKLSTSIKALKDIKNRIYEINPDKILVITPPFQDLNNIVINQSEKYLINFKSFGDLSLEFEAPGDLDYSTRFRDFLRKNDFNVNMFSEEKVNHKAFVPFYYLNKYHTSSKGFENELVHDSSIKNEFMVLNSSQADLNYHWEFGKLLADFLSDKKEDIVIIATSDLLGRVKKQEEYLEIAQEIIDLIKLGKYEEIIGLEEKLKKGSYPGIKPLMIIAPLISKLNLNSNILSLDKEFGEIYLTTEFK
jgi:hypothetical protein